jgi:hypothetical protein
VFVLSLGGCERRRTCIPLLATSADEGEHWHQLANPPMRVGNGDLEHGTIGQMVFANSQDGWLFGPALWVTHDGGRQWHKDRVHSAVEQLAVTNDTVWIVVRKCEREGKCSPYRLLRAPLSSGRFRSVTLPRPLGRTGAPSALAASGRTVAVLNARRPSTTNDSAILSLSTDDGDTWQDSTSPCLRDLGGHLTVAAGSVWSLCPTGSLAGVYRFNGRTFLPQPGPAGVLSSFSSITAAGRRGAVLSTVQDRVSYTTDNGTKWRRSRLEASHRFWSVGEMTFPSATVGYATNIGPRTATYLRSTNGGRSWTRLRSPAIAGPG